MEQRNKPGRAWQHVYYLFMPPVAWKVFLLAFIYLAALRVLRVKRGNGSFHMQEIFRQPAVPRRWHCSNMRRRSRRSACMEYRQACVFIYTRFCCTLVERSISCIKFVTPRRGALQQRGRETRIGPNHNAARGQAKKRLVGVRTCIGNASATVMVCCNLQFGWMVPFAGREVGGWALGKGGQVTQRFGS